MKQPKFFLLESFFAIFLLFLFFSCSNGNKNPYSLSQSEAEFRFKQIQNPKYSLEITLPFEENFQGKAIIQFELDVVSDLRIDFWEGSWKQVIVNTIEKPELAGKIQGFKMIPSRFLTRGKNSIIIEYEAPYSRSGNGLHRFVDPDDGQMYVYSQFEAYHANKVFPCFDQPDLKATFSLEVTAPKSWKVISSTLSTTSTPSLLYKDFQIFSFPESQKFSTYLFSLHGGPFEEWNSEYKSIPLRLFARKSLAKYVVFDDWFRFTKEGFAFFENYFAIPYPFGKYDQVIVPEFNFGAMENIAAVTFSERFVSRGPMTRSQKENLSNVILHEMAHMWFGNLVTMKWWDGLWLNESFATYMASLAQSEGTEFKESWETFFEKMKNWAYKEDSLSTNHPIQAQIADTEEASSHFDGITYGKGAAVLKQLSFFVGDQGFQKGIQSYLKENSFGNTTIKQFLDAIGKANEIDLSHWSKTWLEKKGTNSISFHWTCNSQGFLMHWKQSAKAKEFTLRPHRLLIGYESGTEWKTVPLRYNRYIQKIQINDSVCPAFVVANVMDHDFVHWTWDKRTLSQFPSILEKSPDSFGRLMLWESFFQQIISGKITFDDFLPLAKASLEKDSSLKIQKWLLQRLASDSSNSYAVSRFWLPKDKRDKDLLELSQFFWNLLGKAQPGSDLQKYVFQACKETAFDQVSQERLWSVYKDPARVPGLVMDSDLKWSILIKLASLGRMDVEFQEAWSILKTQDTSIRGKNSSLVVEAIQPKSSVKEKFFDLLRDPNKSQLSNSTLRSIASQMLPIYQMELYLPLKPLFFQSLKKFPETTDENYIAGFTQAFPLNQCTKSSIRDLEWFLFFNYDLPYTIHRELKKHLDSEKSCFEQREAHLFR